MRHRRAERMEVDRGRAADLKDAVHRDCAPTVLVLPTAPVCSFHPSAGDLHCALLRTSCVAQRWRGCLRSASVTALTAGMRRRRQ